MTEVLSELKAMETICGALQSLEPGARQRAVQWLLGALGMPDDLPSPIAVTPEQQNLNGDGLRGIQGTIQATTPNKITPTELSPKEFIIQKQPQSTVERITCLAFYLTHNRQTPMFSGAEIEALNRESAGPSINRYRDMDSTSRAGYLAPADNRKRQISPKGEQMVKALPDREAVKAIQAKYPAQRKRRSSTSKKRGTANGEAE